jgi:hypothetical protein
MIAVIGCVRLNLAKLPIFGCVVHLMVPRLAKIRRDQDSSDLILHFRLNFFLPLSEPSFP